MKGISRRTRACAVVAATGVAVLAGAGAAQAQRPASDRRRYSDGSDRACRCSTTAATSAPAATRARRTRSPATSSAADGTQCDVDHRGTTPDPAAACSSAAGTVLTRCSSSCSKGVDNIELFGHAGFPANERSIPRPGGLPRAARQVRPARRRLARHLNDVNPPGPSASPRPRSSASTTSARAASPPRASTPTTARCAPPRPSTASARTRVEAGVGPVYIHNHTGEFDAKYVDNGVLKYGLADPDGAHRPRYVAGRGRRLLVLGRVQRRHRHGDRRADQHSTRRA